MSEPAWVPEMKEAVKDLRALMNAAGDQAGAMSDFELGDCLLRGRWSTIEIHEAGMRLTRRTSKPEDIETAIEVLANTLYESGQEIGEIIEARRAERQ